MIEGEKQSVLRGGPEVGFRNVEIDDFDREVGIFSTQISRSVGSPSDGTWNPANRNAGATFPDATPKRAGSPKNAGKNLTYQNGPHFRLFFPKSMEMMGEDRNKEPISNDFTNVAPLFSFVWRMHEKRKNRVTSP